MKKSKTIRYETFDHTADIGLKAYGDTLKEAFENAALGMFSIMTDLRRVKDKKPIDIRVEAKDRESLLAEWLNELIYLFEVEKMLFKRFEILDWDEENFLQAVAYGEEIDLDRHEIQAQIKACTYHMLRIEKNSIFTAQVIFDV